MRARFALALVAVLTSVATGFAQPPAPPGTPRTPPSTAPAPRSQPPRPSPDQTPPPPPPPPVAGARRQGQPVNIKVEFTITDQRGAATPVKRTVSVIVADAHTGMIRSQASVAQIGEVPLNIDTSPELLADGKVRLGFNVQYDWPAPVAPSDATAMPGRDARGTIYRTSIHDSVSIILESGKPMIAAQSADPIGDRQVTVEVKATVLK